MLNKALKSIVLWALRSKRLTGEPRTEVITALIENINAIPIQNIFQFDMKGRLFVNGQSIPKEKAMAIISGAQALRDSKVRQMVKDQLTYEAIKLGVHRAINIESIDFSKAIIWVLQEEDKLLAKLAGESYTDVA